MSRSKRGAVLSIIDELYSQMPAFTDIFSEDSFYVFAFFFVISTVLVAFILSRFITIKPVE